MVGDYLDSSIGVDRQGERLLRGASGAARPEEELALREREGRREGS